MWYMRIFIIVNVLLIGVVPAWGQTFNSGSTGADGPFAPTTNTTLAVPPSGVFNFTTVDIPFGVTVIFTPNASNAPVTILASSHVFIGGNLIIEGSPGNLGNSGGLGGAGGPGAFRGGSGSSQSAVNAGSGFGAGGGNGGSSSSLFDAGGGSFATEGTNGGPIYGTADRWLWRRRGGH